MNNRKNYNVAIATLFIGILIMGAAVAESAPVPDRDQAPAPVLMGQVVDAQSGQAVSGITVTLEGTDQATETNRKGMFRFTELSSGTYTIIIEVDGYQEFSKEVDVKERGKNLTVELVPSR